MTSSLVWDEVFLFMFHALNMNKHSVQDAHYSVRLFTKLTQAFAK